LNRGNSPNRMKINRYLPCFWDKQSGRFRPVTTACFLRNTRPKSAVRTCGKGASSLLRGGLPLM
jgi:hypothetical protein